MRCSSQDAIQKPDDETIYHQDYERDDARRVPQMPRLQRNQRSGGENHEQFSPAFLQINTDTFGKKNGGIENCEQRGSAKIPAFDHVLKLVQEVNNRSTMQQKKFVTRPVRDRIEPACSAINKEQRKTENEKKKALKDLENRDQLEIADASRPLQNFWLGNDFVHFSRFVKTSYSAMIGFSRQQISSLLPSGSSKKNA